MSRKSDSPEASVDRTPVSNLDPNARDPPRSARLVLLLGIVSGVGSVIATPFVGPEQFMLASDVYYYAADALLAGENVYEVTPPDRPGYYYIYPPVVTFLFLPHVLLASPVAAFVLQTALNIVFAVGIGVVLWRALSRRGISLSRLDGGLLVGFALLSAYSAITVVNGQVNIWLAFAFALGLDALDHRRYRLAGAAFGAAALVKVFPALLGLWLLRLRAWSAIVVAIGVGVAGLLVGLLALGPDLTVTYFTEVLTGRYDGFDGAPDPTQSRDGAQRQIAAVFGLGPPYVTVVALGVLGSILGYLYLDVETDAQRQAAVLGTILVTLLFFPLQRLYMILLVFPLVILLYLLPPGRSRTVLLVGAVVSFLRLDYSVVELSVTTVPLPAAVESGALAVAEPFFQVILPPTLGMWLMLVACLFVQYDSDSSG